MNSNHGAPRPRHTRDSRSRSPRGDGQHSHRHRTRSPHDKSHRRHHGKSQKAKPKAILPLRARPLSKDDFENYKALFASYLDIQKQIYLEELDEREARGRWKSFVGKWNRGELAEGWYEPSLRAKAAESARDAASLEPPNRVIRQSPDHNPASRQQDMKKEEEESSSDDEFGPRLPDQSGSSKRAGPLIPRLEDLELRKEMSAEDANFAREDLRYERKQDRKVQKERLEELVPRADAGTRERQMEKRAAVTSTHASFKERKSPGADEVGEGTLMGDDGGIHGYKAAKQEAERKKSEREIRREEIWRARAVEREERLQEYREKEDKTMEMLKALAKQRFG
ncbi:hypothetical protein K402DRAFT_331518 [Aulographum hederae CBS 113979]|uniref:RNA helicase HEL117 n=1 Tax=Aulographum hederae CBS 113979 TaxID=1176131 RepID=A0A6G1H238_9PEZI|nr:hypothetical protein K402DRAFT_331518 [Aulographum hederae CBS 113979]